MRSDGAMATRRDAARFKRPAQPAEAQARFNALMQRAVSGERG